MKKIINFSGLGFEVGQTKKGLTLSPEFARNYFSILRNADLEIVDREDLLDESPSLIKVYNDFDLAHVKWTKYKEAYSKTIGLLRENIPLINWGGDHSVAISTVGAFTHCFKNGYVIWIDAHADLNLPSKSITGNLHGMPLSILLNLENVAKNNFEWIENFLDPKKLIYVGLRDLDPFELEILLTLGIKYYTYEEIQKKGIGFVSNEIIETVKNDPVHISFDIDSVNPEYAPSTGVPVASGLTQNDLSLLGDMFFSNLNIRSLDIVEVNPLIGTSLQVDQTYIIAFNFFRSIFTHMNPGDQDERVGKRSQAERLDEMEWCL
jgi:arginase